MRVNGTEMSLVKRLYSDQEAAVRAEGQFQK